MHKLKGFTLIEVIIFIIVTGLLANAILLAFSENLKKTPAARQQIIANQVAQQCMEWFIGQRRINGFATLTCPSSSVPSFCTAPSGYAIAVSITCPSDVNLKNIAVTVSGNGDASLTSLVAAY